MLRMTAIRLLLLASLSKAAPYNPKEDKPNTDNANKLDKPMVANKDMAELHHHHHDDGDNHHHHMEEEVKYQFSLGDFNISNSPFAVIFGDVNVKVTNTEAADDILYAGITEIGENIAAIGELTTALDIVGGLTSLSDARKKRSGDEQSGDEMILMELVDRVTNLVEKCGNGDICDSNEIKKITQNITSTFNKMEATETVSTMFQNSFDEKKAKLDMAISAAEKTQGEDKIKALTALAVALSRVCTPNAVNQEACFCQNVNVCGARQGCCACGTCLDVCIVDVVITNACFCENVQGGGGEPCWSGGQKCGTDGTCTAGGN